MTDTPRSAYLHFPFCRHKCDYCDFVSFAGKENLRDAYIRAICREIRLTATSRDPVKPLSTVYFGGGTPSLFSPEQLTEVLLALKNGFGFEPDAEITVEVNPGTVTSSDLAHLRASGFNRVSIGVQTFSDALLHAIGRIHDAAKAESCVIAAQEAGFTNIGCDLMTGLPGQTVEDVENSAARLLRLNVPHISFYALSIESGTPFAARYKEDDPLLPPPETEREMYHRMLSILERHGYIRYEISNCSLPGYESRHNTVYWKSLPYYGFGCGAHCFVDSIRSGNTASLDDYLQIMENPEARREDLITESDIISAEERMDEYMLLGFRLSEGVNEKEFTARFGVGMRERYGDILSGLISRGLIESRGSRCFLSEHGLDYANEVFREFVGKSIG